MTTVRTILCLGCIYLASIVGINAQCVATPTDACIEVHQSLLDRSSQVATELKAARDVIAKFETERTFTEAERNAAKTLTASLNEALDVRGRIIADQERMQTIYQRVIDMQSEIIERLEKQLSKGKSGFQKLAGILEKVVLVLAGAGLAGL